MRPLEQPRLPDIWGLSQVRVSHPVYEQSKLRISEE